MPRTPKRNKYTGSRLLGEELKRLRGGRSLGEIARLSNATPFCDHVLPISAPSLCQIESGMTMPTLARMYTLSHILKISMNQLMGFIVEDRLAAGASALDELSADALRKDFARRLTAGEWHRALPLALAGERTASDERARVGWRGNRALCLSRIGLHDEAIATLTACAESRSVDARQRMQIFRNLAELHAAGGYFQTAALVAQHALELGTRLDLEARDIALLQRMRAGLLIDTHRHGLDADERHLSEALWACPDLVDRVIDHAVPRARA